MSNSVNPILLRPVLGIVLPIDSVLLKMEQLMSWLQSGHHAVSFFPSGSNYSICKTTQECASDTERLCDAIVLIINYLSLLFCDSGRLGKLQLFYKQEAGDMEGPLYLGGNWGGEPQDSAQFHRDTTGNKTGSNVDCKLKREAQIIKIMI